MYFHTQRDPCGLLLTTNVVFLLQDKRQRRKRYVSNKAKKKLENFKRKTKEDEVNDSKSIIG